MNGFELQEGRDTPVQELFVPADIGLIGYGIVGEAVANGFSVASKGRDRIRWYDKFKPGGLPLETVAQESEVIFIGLPTPMKRDGSGIDLSIIEQNVAQIAPITSGTDKIIAIKSTVTPGTTRRLAEQYPDSTFCMNPEFLTEARYLRDFLNAPETIIGADKDLTLRRMSTLYSPRFPNSEMILTDPTTAEMIKYARNFALSAKVTIGNILFDACQALGISYDEVRVIFARDPRIGSAHLNVTSDRGFGGKCFPKDLIALMGMYEEMGIDASVMRVIWDYNLSIRKVHDWEDIPFAVTGDQGEAS